MQEESYASVFLCLWSAFVAFEVGLLLHYEFNGNSEAWLGARNAGKSAMVTVMFSLILSPLLAASGWLAWVCYGFAMTIAVFAWVIGYRKFTRLAPPLWRSSFWT